MKVTIISQEEFNHMDKSKTYRQMVSLKDDKDEEDRVKQWLEYRGTPNAEVFKFVRPTGSVVWRVKV